MHRYFFSICYPKPTPPHTGGNNTHARPLGLSSGGRARRTSRVGRIDRRTSGACSRLGASLYACHPRLVNGYSAGAPIRFNHVYYRCSIRVSSVAKSIYFLLFVA